MKQKLLLKTMLLLCALIAGSSSAWADDPKVTLSNANIVAAGSADNGYKDWDLGNNWSAYAIKNQHSNATSSYHFLQIKKYEKSTAYYIHVPTLGDKILSIKMTVSSTQKAMDGGDNSATLYFSASSSTSATGNGVASGTGASSVTIDCSDLNLNTGYITASAGVRIWDVEVTYYVESDDPSISVSPTSRTVFYDTEDGKFNVTYNQIAANNVKEVLFFESDGTTPATYDWFDANIDDDGNVEYILDVNTHTENSRTAYFKVHGKSTVNGADIYSDLISITQGKNSVDYATLPFVFDGGKGNMPTGLTHSGLGDNYSNSPKLKFDTQGDYLILKVKETKPKELKFDIKGNSMGGTYAFKVQWSANGFDYTDLDTYTSISSSTSTKTIDISACSKLRYIKWVYTTRASGNVALGNIKVTPETKEVSTKTGRNYGSYVTTDILNFSAAEGITAYIATGFNQAKTAIVLEEVDVVPANTPIIVKTTTQGATVKVPVATVDADNVSTNKLVAGDGTTTWDGTAGYTYYFLKQDQFYKATSGTLQSGKAYFKIATSEVPANGAPALGFDLGDGTTSIDATLIDNGGMINDNVIYDLSGRRVANPTKGLYIMNGKKFVVK